MIDTILPRCVVSVEARDDSHDGGLLPAEEARVARAVEKRRREFTTARVCARLALAQLGVPPLPIGTGERGEPLWPPGVVGSITHTEGYRASAVARASDILTIGVDAEPNAPLPDGVLAEIARPDELPDLVGLDHEFAEIHWGRLLFSAKESVYKAWYPLAKRWLGFEDATVTIDPAAGTFDARLLVAGPSIEGRRICAFSGRWLAQDGLILTAVSESRRTPGRSS
jgi:4'-phosphopantetheinyl transferase EntD